jgi:hypothetical protein
VFLFVVFLNSEDILKVLICCEEVIIKGLLAQKDICTHLNSQRGFLTRRLLS